MVDVNEAIRNIAVNVSESNAAHPTFVAMMRDACQTRLGATLVSIDRDLN